MELVTVMVVIGVLAAIAVPRMARTDAFSSNAYRNEVASALRHAQKSATSHLRMVCATISPGAITLRIAASAADADCTNDYTSPDGSNYASRDSNIVAGGAFVNGRLLFMPTGEIRQDAAGRPFATGTITVTGQPAIQIDGRTGYVQ